MRKNKPDHSEIFGRDDLDEAVINADDTGMVAEQHEITEEEMLRGLEGERKPEEE
jgi:hypothetical protein